MVFAMSKLGRSLVILGVGILLASLLSACGGALPADLMAALPDNVKISDSGSEMSFSGHVQAMSSDSWTVEGVSFNVNGATQIKGDIAVGDMVKVHLTLDSAAGTLLATEIETSTEPQTDESPTDTATDKTPEPTQEMSSTPSPDETPEAGDYESVGVVTAMAAGTWTIGDKTVTITDQTEVKDAIILGDTVEVQAKVTIDGTIAAQEIKLSSTGELPKQSGDQNGDSEQDGIEMQVSGTVDAYSSTSITVNGQSIDLLPSTKIEGALDVGVQVQVEAVLNADGSLSAKSVEVKSGTAISTSTSSDGAYEAEDGTRSEDHHEGSGDDSKSSSDEGHNGSGSASDD
jgi:hypothetical protein